MAYENIRLAEPNMTYYGGYFYSFTSEVLYKKLPDGDIAFGYILDTILNNTVNSLEYDTLFFWTLEQPGNDLLIRKWCIDNYLCKLDKTYKFNGFNSSAFSVEYYTSVLATTASGGEFFITIEDDFENVVCSGTKVYLGEGSFLEDNYIDSISGSTIKLKTPIQYTHQEKTKFYTATNLLLVLDDYLYKYPLERDTSDILYYWDGNHNDKHGLWEYVIAENVELDAGVYFANFNVYDADNDHEIALRIESVSGTIDVIARREWNSNWCSQTNLVYLPVSGTYTIKGRQLINNTYSWGLDSVRLRKVDLYLYSSEKGYWAGSHSNKTGSWEYTIASDIYFDIGTYYVIFDAYDNDTKGEMGLRLDGVGGIIDVKANKTGNNSWVTQTGIFNITVSGTYDIKGRQHKSSGYRWG